jgi:hypothetical protein
MQRSEMNIISRALRKSKFLAGYLRSHLLGEIYKARYRDLKCFLIFVGYPRSGHTLIAALLDAHPNIMVSIEWAALSHLRMGYRKNGMLYAIEKHSRLFTEKLSNVWTGYAYRVEGQWQGRSDKILVMGDKLAGQTSKILREDPELLDELKQLVGIEIKIIHVIRNPFDTITTIAHRALEKTKDPLTEPDLPGFSEKYFKRAEVVNAMKTEGEYPIFDLYHEDFIRDPGGILAELMGFLGLGHNEKYIRSCSEIVYTSPHQRRREYQWPDDLKNAVQEQINKYDFLSRYNFDD